MIYIVTINNKKYEVEVERGQASILSTSVIESPVIVPNVKMSSEISEHSKTQIGISQVMNGEPIKSPIPGNILDIRISEGDSVKKGQILFILEAMKMENEIVAPNNGKVTQILVTKGSSVMTGDILAALKE